MKAAARRLVLGLVLPTITLVILLALGAGPLTLDFALPAIAVGFAGGLAGGLVSGAIGLVSVPLLVVFLGLPVHQAAATNLFQTIFTAISGALTHARLGNVRMRLAAPLVAGSLLGAPAGALTALALPEATLKTLFLVALLGVAASLARRTILGPRPHKRTAAPAAEPESEAPRTGWRGLVAPIQGTHRGRNYRVAVHMALGLGVAIGFMSGLLGIGGGFLIAPLMAGLLGVPVHLALGTGLVVIAGNGAFGAAPHAAAGTVLWLTGTLLAIGGAIGASIGSHISHRLPERALTAMFLVVVLFVAWRLAG